MTISTPTTAGRSAATCPVFGLAQEAQAIVAAFTAGDEAAAKLPAGNERARLERTGRRLLDRLDRVEARAAQLRATSLEGALYQAVLAMAQVDALAGLAVGSAFGVEAEEHATRAEGLLASVLAVMEEINGADRAVALGSWHGQPEPAPELASA